jgi:hypothetical protein
MNWFRHAFALDPDGSLESTEDERAVAEKVCRMVVRRGMSVPAVAFLEMSRPLNRVAAQALYFFQPVASLALTGDDYNRFARFLERAGSIDFLSRRIEELAADAHDPPAAPERSVAGSEAAAAAPRE